MAYMTDENGNYKRTVRCGHCYEKGHNKSACPERKKDLKANVERYTKELAENKFAHDYQRDNTERYLRHTVNQLEKMANRGKNRKCGFCGEVGHTRRTCIHRKQQVADKTAETLRVRRLAASRMSAGGLGPGTLIKMNDDRMAVISSINFKEIGPSHAVKSNGHFHTCRAVTFQYVVPKTDEWSRRPITMGYSYIPFDFMNVDDLPDTEWRDLRSHREREFQILSGVDIDEDVFLTDENFHDKKQVETWVLDKLVDPQN
jgi:hypothetical protein